MSPGEITMLLQQWASGDREALSLVVEKAYDEFRAIAHAYLRRERANSGVNTTVLVHEFYLRLSVSGLETGAPGRTTRVLRG